MHVGDDIREVLLQVHIAVLVLVVVGRVTEAVVVIVRIASLVRLGVPSVVALVVRLVILGDALPFPRSLGMRDQLAHFVVVIGDGVGKLCDL